MIQKAIRQFNNNNNTNRADHIHVHLNSVDCGAHVITKTCANDAHRTSHGFAPQLHGPTSENGMLCVRMGEQLPNVIGSSRAEANLE